MQQQTRTCSNLSRLNTDIFVRDCERMQMQDIVLAGISMTDVFTLAGCHGGKLRRRTLALAQDVVAGFSAAKMLSNAIIGTYAEAGRAAKKC